MHAHVSCVCDVCVTCVCVHNVFVSLHADKTVYVYLYIACKSVCVGVCLLIHVLPSCLIIVWVGVYARVCACVRVYVYAHVCV